jgi:hypothetical protein
MSGGWSRRRLRVFSVVAMFMREANEKILHKLSGEERVIRSSSSAGYNVSQPSFF